MASGEFIALATRHYSVRSTFIGSRVAARRAGTSAAAIPTSNNTEMVETKVNVSPGSIPNSTGATLLAAYHETGTPINKPAITRNSDPRRTIHSTLARCAPMAMRIPISRERRAAE